MCVSITRCIKFSDICNPGRDAHNKYCYQKMIDCDLKCTYHLHTRIISALCLFLFISSHDLAKTCSSASFKKKNYF